MDKVNRAPTGLMRRRRRISDEETEQRMLHAEMAMVKKTGLTVSLEHISFEDVIRDAGVSRSAVYRRWPYKDLFFSDLLRELATVAGAGALPADRAAEELVRRIAVEHLDWLETAELRHQLLVEILRESALVNFQFFHESTEWRTYLALHATFLSLPAGGLRDDVQAALSRSEQGFIDQISTAYEYVAKLLGYRLRPELGATFETMATLLNATMRGLVLTAPAIPDIASRRIQATPFETARQAEWSQPALGIAAIALNFIEPDSTIKWNDERLTMVHHAMKSQDWPGMHT